MEVVLGLNDDFIYFLFYSYGFAEMVLT
jgi:hypothetical protein